MPDTPTSSPLSPDDLDTILGTSGSSGGMGAGLTPKPPVSPGKAKDYDMPKADKDLQKMRAQLNAVNADKSILDEPTGTRP